MSEKKEEEKGFLQRLTGGVFALAAVSVPVAAAFVSSTVAVRLREAEDKRLELDRVEKLVGYISSKDSSQRLLGIHLMQAWVQSGGVSSSIVTLLGGMMMEDPDASVAKAAYTSLDVLSKDARLDENTRAAVVAELEASGKPLVKLVVNEADRDEIAQTVARLEEAGIAADVEVQSDEPTHLSVRIFREKDQEVGEKIAEALAPTRGSITVPVESFDFARGTLVSPMVKRKQALLDPKPDATPAAKTRVP